MFNKTEKSVDAFWQDYGEKIGETILARSLGQYISGWEEFDSNKWTAVWGLIIATSGGFRFHHFANRNWLESLTGREGSKEKTFFIPKEKIISARFITESNWWKKLLKSSLPQLTITYRDDKDNEQTLFLEVNLISGKNNNSELLAEKLNSLIDIK